MSYRKLRGAYEEARINRFTAATAKKDGDVIVENTRVGVITQADVAAGQEGLAIFGTDEKGIMMPKSAGACARNAKAYWALAGDPVGGTAGTGAVTATAGANLLIGRFAQSATTGDAEALVELTNQ